MTGPPEIERPAPAGGLGAREIVKTLGGRWHGSYGTTRYLADDDCRPNSEKANHHD